MATPRGHGLSRPLEYAFGFSAQPNEIRTITIYSVQVGQESHKENSHRNTILLIQEQKGPRTDLHPWNSKFHPTLTCAFMHSYFLFTEQNQPWTEMQIGKTLPNTIQNQFLVLPRNKRNMLTLLTQSWPFIDEHLSQHHVNQISVDTENKSKPQISPFWHWE